MEVIEAVAIIVLIFAIIILIYYYLLNSPVTMNKFKSYIPSGADAHMNKLISQNSSYSDSNEE